MPKITVIKSPQEAKIETVRDFCLKSLKYNADTLKLYICNLTFVVTGFILTPRRPLPYILTIHIESRYFMVSIKQQATLGAWGLISSTFAQGLI